MNKPEFNYYALPPSGIETMREYSTVLNKLCEDVEALTREYNMKIEATHVAAREQLRDLWYKMAAMTGVDADTSWDNPAWRADTRYLESGFAAITFTPMAPDHPLAALAGAQDEGEVEETVPEGVTIN